MIFIILSSKDIAFMDFFCIIQLPIITFYMLKTRIQIGIQFWGLSDNLTGFKLNTEWKELGFLYQIWAYTWNNSQIAQNREIIEILMIWNIKRSYASWKYNLRIIRIENEKVLIKILHSVSKVQLAFYSLLLL